MEAAQALRTSAAKRRGVGCDDDAIPNDPQDLDEWIGAKMLELRDADDVGELEQFIHLTSLISQGASRMQTKPWQPSVLSNMVFSRAKFQPRLHTWSLRPAGGMPPSMLSRVFEQGVLVVHEEDVESRYGLRGMIIGEASRPGPPRRHISRTIEGKDVIPRMHPTGATQVDEDSDAVDVTHVSQRSRRGRRRVSSDSDVPFPALQGLLPFARFAYGETTTYVWEDDKEVRHTSGREEVASKSIRLCLCCSVWVSTRPQVNFRSRFF